ncbi:MAG TPA: winged helix-turn-helix domain-containing protein [Mycobacteriales bacterium]
MDLGPPKQRVVLAALPAEAGRPVSIETLVNRVWDETPPEKARTMLYAHITWIRRACACGEEHRSLAYRESGRAGSDHGISAQRRTSGLQVVVNRSNIGGAEPSKRQRTITNLAPMVNDGSLQR